MFPSRWQTLGRSFHVQMFAKACQVTLKFQKVQATAKPQSSQNLLGILTVKLQSPSTPKKASHSEKLFVKVFHSACFPFLRKLFNSNKSNDKENIFCWKHSIQFQKKEIQRKSFGARCGCKRVLRNQLISYDSLYIVYSMQLCVIINNKNTSLNLSNASLCGF